MRAAALVGLLVGCYQPNRANSCRVQCDTECPDGLSCENGMCIVPGDICDPDGGVVEFPEAGGPIDMMPPLSCQPLGGIEKALFGGTSYTTDGTIAIYVDSGGIIRQTVVDSVNPGNSIGFEAFNVSRPRLAPDGRDLFMLENNGGTFGMRRATPSGATWVMGPVVSVTGITIGAGFVPGTPTTTNPRRMIAQQSPGIWREGTEDGLGRWTFTTTIKPVGMQTLVDPTLSVDGLRLVFVGNILGGEIEVFVSTRPVVTNGFLVAQPLHDITSVVGMESTPATSPDCKHLYVSVGGAVVRVE